MEVFMEVVFLWEVFREVGCLWEVFRKVGCLSVSPGEGHGGPSLQEPPGAGGVLGEHPVLPALPPAGESRYERLLCAMEEVRLRAE